ncbi:MAG: oxygen-dependent coproporphyrinogen oxidase [Bacteroidota bacterium]
MKPRLDKHLIADAFRGLQDEICDGLSRADGDIPFLEDNWERSGGGGGRTRLINGDKIEKGGVNFSEVFGTLPPKAAQSLRVDPGSKEFFATGVSIVLHPRHPRRPIIHMNVRYFELDNGVCWFGGGIDMTPHYVERRQAASFHQKLKDCCDRFHPDWYDRFKAEADDYFFIPHRRETRGIGGIFYDRLSPGYDGKSLQELFDFSLAVGRTFLHCYVPELSRAIAHEPTEKEINWQRLRRGRYVEFNLVWDRGTKFGLTTNGRTESILMSLPPQASWVYDYDAEAGSEEAKTLSLLRKDIDWISG